jgi:hypothetical protein
MDTFHRRVARFDVDLADAISRLEAVGHEVQRFKDARGAINARADDVAARVAHRFQQCSDSTPPRKATRTSTAQTAATSGRGRSRPDMSSLDETHVRSLSSPPKTGTTKYVLSVSERAFFHALPPPWNAAPDSAAMPANFLRMMAAGSLEKFDGSYADYEFWRSHFISCVHTQYAHISFKVQALNFCLKEAVPKARSLMHSLGTSPLMGYRQVILHLEHTYGGTNRVLSHKLQVLAQMPVAHGDSAHDIDNIVTELEAYKICLTAYGREHEFIYHQFFKAMLALLADQVQLDFWKWAEMQAGAPNTALLLLYLQHVHRALGKQNEYANAAMAPTASARLQSKVPESPRPCANTMGDQVDNRTFNTTPRGEPPLLPQAAAVIAVPVPDDTAL